jgi:hypothetical protein
MVFLYCSPCCAFDAGNDVAIYCKVTLDCLLMVFLVVEFVGYVVYPPFDLLVFEFDA